MADASLELQQAIVATLKADPALSALVGDRIYDNVPSSAVKPYVSLGPEDWVSDDADCIQSHQGAVQIDIWSNAIGKPEAKRIANAVQDALHDAELPLDVHALVLLEHRITRYFIESDGITKHAAMDFRALTDAP